MEKLTLIKNFREEYSKKKGSIRKGHIFAIRYESNEMKH